jgi:hypothetical protein
VHRVADEHDLVDSGLEIGEGPVEGVDVAVDVGDDAEQHAALLCGVELRAPGPGLPAERTGRRTEWPASGRVGKNWGR